MILNLALKILTNRYVLLGVTTTLIATSGYIYYARTKARIQNLQNKTVQQSVTIRAQKRTIDALRVNYENSIKLRDELIRQTLITQQQLETVRNNLYRENSRRQSLETLATKRTTLVEKKVNDATRRVWREFETLTKRGIR